MSVPREIDLRRFPAIPRATIKVFWGVDDGNIAGARRFVAEVGAVMVVHATFATLLAMAPRREGTLGKMRLSPIARALREKVFDHSVAIKHPETTSASGKEPSSTAAKEPSGKPVAAVT